MSKTVEGIYRDGRVELLETPTDVTGARVVVTFLTEGTVDLQERGIEETQAADLRRADRRSRRIGSARRWGLTMPYKRGDVVLVLFPDSNLRTAKRRPALVVQADNLGTGLPQVIVAMITSNMVRAGYLSRVTIKQASSWTP